MHRTSLDPRPSGQNGISLRRHKIHILSTQHCRQTQQLLWKIVLSDNMSRTGAHRRPVVSMKHWHRQELWRRQAGEKIENITSVTFVWPFFSSLWKFCLVCDHKVYICTSLSQSLSPSHPSSLHPSLLPSLLPSHLDTFFPVSVIPSTNYYNPVVVKPGRTEDRGRSSGWLAGVGSTNPHHITPQRAQPIE